MMRLVRPGICPEDPDPQVIQDTKVIMGYYERFAISLFYCNANEQSLPLPHVSQSTHEELLMTATERMFDDTLHMAG